MKRRGDHQAERHVADLLAHAGLSDERVGDHFGERAIIADAAGEQKLDIVSHALVHDPAFELAACNRLADAAGAANTIDRPQVVLVAGFDDVAAVESNAETGAVESLLDVVRRQSVTGKEAVDVAAADEVREMLDTAGVNDRRAADEQGLATVATRADQFVGDLADRNSFWLLGRDRAVHELEPVRLCLPSFGMNSHAGMADDKLLAELHIRHRPAAGGTRFRVDDNAAVHLLQPDLDPAAANSDFSSLVGRAVEAVREGPGDVGSDETRVLAVRRSRAVIGNVRQDLLQAFRCWSMDRDQGKACVALGLADSDLLNAERTTPGRDVIEHLRQEKAVDNVAGQFDPLDKSVGGLGSLGGHGESFQNSGTGDREFYASEPGGGIERTAVDSRWPRSYGSATMGYSRGIYALAVLFLAVSAAFAQSPFAPQQGLLLLKNGNVLAGEITSAGDYYLVLIGKTSELRVPAKDVEAHVANLNEAYELKTHGMFGRGAAPHVDLAEWCLRQGLHARCAEQLAKATAVDADNPKIAELERRLKLATEVRPEPKPASTISSTSATASGVSTEQIDQAVKALPKGSVERFAAVVQPLLMNRCGANSCHGANSKAAMHFVRPPNGQSPPQRFTHRNLFAVLQQLDSSKPESSPLLIEAQRKHGPALTAPLDKQTQRQFEELKAWVLLTMAAPDSSPPATIAVDSPTTLSQAPPANAGLASADESPDEVTSPKRTAKEKFTPRDSFDAEIFNRRFHPPKQ